MKLGTEKHVVVHFFNYLELVSKEIIKMEDQDSFQPQKGIVILLV